MSRTQGKRWCITVNNYTTEDYATIKEKAFTDITTYCVIGKEVATSGTPHLQAFIVFFNNQSPTSVKNLFGTRAHIELAKGTTVQAATYCKKDNCYEEWGNMPTNQGKRTDIDDFVTWLHALDRRPSARDVANHFPGLYVKYSRLMDLVDSLQPQHVLVNTQTELRDWQEDAYDILNNMPNDRQVYFYVDEDGNSGKSWFCKYCLTQMPDKVQILSIGKREDLTFAIDETKSIFLFDIPRGGLEFFQYNVLEKLKDQFIFSCKYSSKLKVLSNIPHVMLFTNETPDMTKMSIDRYKVIMI
ncbi:MAG: hypothetical protein ACRC1D_10235 [Culicoidibacterales bacterium]